VTTAVSGLQALEFLGLVDDKQSSVIQTQIPKVNLVCSDYHMPPGMTGYELLKKIKQESAATKDVPVVIVSSDAETTRVNECLEAGAVMFISKPFQSADVENLKNLM
ncbi:two-component response regulator arr17, partial [Phtheirospermum japonicum]